MEQFRDASTVESMSNEEAEEVVARFTQRQKEIQERLSMPTVNDLSEALNADPKELQAILGEIRASQNMPPLAVAPAEAKARRILPFAIIAVILVAGAAILLPVRMSVNDSREVPVSVAPPIVDSVAPEPATYVDPTVSPNQIPSFLSLTVDGAKVTGTGTWQHVVDDGSTAAFEQNVLRQLKAMIHVYAPESTAAHSTELTEDAVRSNLKFRTNNDWFRFIPLTATIADETVSTTIPVLSTSSLDGRIIVQDQQNREVKIFANKVAQLYEKLKGKIR